MENLANVGEVKTSDGPSTCDDIAAVETSNENVALSGDSPNVEDFASKLQLNESADLKTKDLEADINVTNKKEGEKEPEEANQMAQIDSNTEENNMAGNVSAVAAFTPVCEMCHNYEVNLTKMQDAERNLKEQLSAAQHLADRYQKELSGERLYRKEMEARISTLCADNEREVKLANKGNEECAGHLAVVDQKCEQLIQEQQNKIQCLKERLRSMNNDMLNLSNKYLKLLGSNRKCAAEMQAQTIELPQDVDQLQFLCLQIREELIETRAAKEHAEAVLRDEITMLQVQRREDEIEKRRIEHAFTEQVNGVSQELGLARSQLSSMQDASSKVEEMDKRMVEYQEVIEDLEKQVDSMQKERKDLEMTVALYKQKCAALQQELDTSETVQKDFVKLSQNLQIELEKIRQAEQEVRWQFDEDVHACNQCESAFLKNRPKLHCYHCGKIFCSVCLTATVPSGPHRKLAKVCQVCHTLLSRDSAPFFSQNSTSPT